MPIVSLQACVEGISQLLPVCQLSKVKSLTSSVARCFSHLWSLETGASTGNACVTLAAFSGMPQAASKT